MHQNFKLQLLNLQVYSNVFLPVFTSEVYVPAYGQQLTQLNTGVRF
jgi:hypothetical protein